MVWAAAQFRHYAPGLYYAPQLWGTTDGCIPFRRFWIEYVLMTSALAMRRREIASAVSLATGGEALDSARAATDALADPTFVEGRAHG